MKRIASLGCSMLTIALLLPHTGRVAYAQSAPDINDAYTAFYIEENVPKKNDMAEQFLKTFKDSKDPSAEQYREAAYLTLIRNYAKTNDSAKLMNVAERTEELVPSASAAFKANGYAQGMAAAYQSNNVPKTLSFGAKVLAIIPDDLNTLTTLSSTIPAALPTDPTARTTALALSDKYAMTALDVVAHLDPAKLGLSATDWATQKPGILGSLHTTLGGNAYTEMNYDKAIEWLTMATKETPKNDLAWYQMGLAQSQQAYVLSTKVQAGVIAINKLVAAKGDTAEIQDLKGINDGLTDAYRAKLEDAVTSLATAVACAGPVQQPAHDELVKKWKQGHKDSTDGMEEFIKSKKQP